MRGVILSAGSAQGLVLGDDGVRYTFISSSWQDSTLKARPGIRVDFTEQGAYATNVRVTQGQGVATYAAPTLPYQPPTVPSNPIPNSLSNSLPGATVPSRASRSRFAGHGKSKTTVALLSIFLGPFGATAGSFYIGGQQTSYGCIQLVCYILLAPLYILFPPFLLVLWLLPFIIGVIWIFKSEESFDKHVHYMRDHKAWTWKMSRKHPSLCLTGECRTPKRRSSSSAYGKRKTCSNCSRSIPYIAVRCGYCSAKL